MKHFLPAHFFIKSLIVICICSCLFTGCTPINVYEKNTTIPQYNWSNSLKPSFDFNITDTTSQYSIYVVLRHTDAYRYNNIWLNVQAQFPGDTLRSQRLELVLGNDASGWEGTGMNDIWEVRKPITKGPAKFPRPGTYRFTLEQVMRDNPLPHIMSVGIRVERFQ
ncbi:MAG TPA: gliding motility lipoprotein GldH [Ferruginibacter sp.]|nr:gliding motility lipoprotein GldH [Ferruginibacter sp.]HMP20703.1 gliding motility lipoprotein GldH [Ferruginibacter sp.]